MSQANNKSIKNVSEDRNAPAARPSFSPGRWASRSSRPKLVSFSWAGVAHSGTHR